MAETDNASAPAPETPSLPALPLVPFEEYMLLDDRPAYPMNFFLRLRFAGCLVPELFDDACRQAVARHPLLAARVTRRKRRWYWSTDAPLSPVPGWHSSSPEEEILAATPIDLSEDPGLRIVGQQAGEAAAVTFQFHHAACDGLGAFQYLGDVLTAYSHALGETERTLEDRPLDGPLLQQRGSFGLTRGRLLRMLPRQLLGVLGARQFFIRQPVTLAGAEPNEPADDPSASACPPVWPASLTRQLTARETRDLRAAARNQQVTVNDVLARDWFLALGEHQRAVGEDKSSAWLRTSIPISLRCPRDRRMPAANLILCVRECDPGLVETVRGLLRQDYGEYAVQIVVDHREDPAWPVIEQVIRQESFRAVQMSPLEERSPTCSRKIAGILQTVRHLDAKYEVIALLDSDTIPHKTWLQELVRPLSDPAVGAVTGNRWYAPPMGNWGSLVRYLWNAGAVVQMYWYRQPWGGSMTLRAELLRSGPLLDELAIAFGEDSTVSRSLGQQGLHVAFAPEVLMVNQETCSLAAFFRFLCRQMVIVRLHNPAWPIILGHGWGLTLAQVAALAVVAWSLFVGDGIAAGWSMAGLGAYWASMFAMLAFLELSVRRVAGRRGKCLPPWSLLFALRMAVASLLTQIVYAVGLWRALWLRQHCWRGVTYRFGSGEIVRVIDDEPYQLEPHHQVAPSNPSSI